MDEPALGGALAAALSDGSEDGQQQWRGIVRSLGLVRVVFDVSISVILDLG